MVPVRISALSCVLLLAGFVPSRAAAQAPTFDLAHPMEVSEWRVSTVDRPEHSRVDFDDQMWPLEDFATTAARRSEWSWLRTELDVPEELDERAGDDGFALAFRARAAVEVFADGVIVARTGRPGDEATDSPFGVTTTAILPRAMTRDGHVSLAVRVYNSPAQAASRVATIAEVPRFGYAPLVRLQTLEAEQRRLAPINAAGGALAALMLMVAVGHLAIYLRRRDLDGYLWYSLFVFAGFAWEVSTLCTVNRLVPLARGNSVSTGLTFILGALGSEFILRFLLAKAPGRAWSVARVVLLTLGSLFIVGGLPVTAMMPTPMPELFWVANLFAMVAVILREVWRGNPDARTTFVGVLLAFAFFLVMVLMQVGLLPRTTISVGHFGIVPFIGAMGLALMNHFTRTLQRLDETNIAAQRFVPFEFLSLLGRKDIVGVVRGEAVERELSILFADIRNFTSRLENLPPKESFAFVNDYLHAIEPCIRKHGGYIHQYLGDGIVAMFPGSAHSALRAAIEMQRVVRALSMSDALGVIEVGIGLHRGRVMLGTIGGLEQLDAGVVSDAMNLTARVESLTKRYGTRLLVTDAVVSALEPNAFALREVDCIVAKGKGRATTLYECLEVLDGAGRSGREAQGSIFAEALLSYRKGQFKEAEVALAQVILLDESDGPARELLTRTRLFLRDGTPSNWDGTFHLDAK